MSSSEIPSVPNKLPIAPIAPPTVKAAIPTPSAVNPAPTAAIPSPPAIKAFPSNSSTDFIPSTILGIIADKISPEIPTAVVNNIITPDSVAAPNNICGADIPNCCNPLANPDKRPPVLGVNPFGSTALPLAAPAAAATGDAGFFLEKNPFRVPSKPFFSLPLPNALSPFFLETARPVILSLYPDGSRASFTIFVPIPKLLFIFDMESLSLSLGAPLPLILLKSLAIIPFLTTPAGAGAVFLPNKPLTLDTAAAPTFLTNIGIILVPLNLLNIPPKEESPLSPKVIVPPAIAPAPSNLPTRPPFDSKFLLAPVKASLNVLITRSFILIKEAPIFSGSNAALSCLPNSKAPNFIFSWNFAIFSDKVTIA